MVAVMFDDRRREKAQINRRTTAYIEELYAFSSQLKRQKLNEVTACSSADTNTTSSTSSSISWPDTQKSSSKTDNVLIKPDCKHQGLTPVTSEQDHAPAQQLTENCLPYSAFSSLSAVQEEDTCTEEEIDYQLKEGNMDRMEDFNNGDDHNFGEGLDADENTVSVALPSAGSSLFKPRKSESSSASVSLTVPLSSMASTATASVASYATSQATTVDGIASLSDLVSTRGIAKKAGSKKQKQKPGYTAKGAERKFVKHNYIDRAGETHDKIQDNDDALFETYTVFNNKRKQCDNAEKGDTDDQPAKKPRSAPFPLKVHMLLTHIAREGLESIASWLPHGRAFQIHDMAAFQDQIMVKFFAMTRITSFHRQLNLYGFIRLTTGKDEGAYYNEFFLRGKPYLTMHINRIKVKGTKIRAASSPDEEPDFYSMPYVNPDYNPGKGGTGYSKSVSNASKTESLKPSEVKQQSKPRKPRSRSKREKRKGTGAILRKGGGYKASPDNQSADEDNSNNKASKEKIEVVTSLSKDETASQMSSIQHNDIIGMTSPIRQWGATNNYASFEGGNDSQQQEQQQQQMNHGVTSSALNQDFMSYDQHYSMAQSHEQLHMHQLSANAQLVYIQNSANLSQYHSQPTFAATSAGINNNTQSFLGTSYSAAILQQQQQQLQQQLQHDANISSIHNFNTINNNNISYPTVNALGDAWGPRYQHSETNESVSTSAHEETWNTYRYQPSIAESGADTAAVSDRVLDSMTEDVCSYDNEMEDHRKELMDQFEQWENDSLEPLKEETKNWNNLDDDVAHALKSFWKEN